MIYSIESERPNTFFGQDADIDKFQIDRDRVRSYNKVLDSAIEGYRAKYKSDEKRYKQYLKVLFEYKKIYYEYNALVKLTNENSKLSKAEKQSEYRDILQNIRAIQHRSESYKLAAMWDIFD